MVLHIVKLMKTTCRVPLQVLSLRLSILYLRTFVGLGYGSYSNIIFLVLSYTLDFLYYTHQTEAFALVP